MIRPAVAVMTLSMTLLLDACSPPPYGPGYIVVPAAGPAVQVVPGEAVPAAPVGAAPQPPPARAPSAKRTPAPPAAQKAG